MHVIEWHSNPKIIYDKHIIIRLLNSVRRTYLKRTKRQASNFWFVTKHCSSNFLAHPCQLCMYICIFLHYKYCTIPELFSTFIQFPIANHDCYSDINLIGIWVNTFITTAWKLYTLLNMYVVCTFGLVMRISYIHFASQLCISHWRHFSERRYIIDYNFMKLALLNIRSF